MQYMLLIYGNEAQQASRSASEQSAELEKYMAFARTARTAGVMKAGDELDAVANARSLRTVNGRLVTHDGPFAETKEQLGGFFILECANMEEALAWAARLPTVENGCVEVRPVIDHSAG